MSMARNGPSCVWNFGMVGSTVGKNPSITRDPKELAEAVREVLEQGSINLYMFHGGTNFGFMNGCSARGTLDYHKSHLTTMMPFSMKKEIQLLNT